MKSVKEIKEMLEILADIRCKGHKCSECPANNFCCSSANTLKWVLNDVK